MQLGTSWNPVTPHQNAQDDPDDEIELLSDRALLQLFPRPQTRAGCVDGPRPCPHVTCRHHMLTEVSDIGQAIFHVGQRGYVDPEIILDVLMTMPQSCALDVADEAELRGVEVTLEAIKEFMQLSRERIRQVEGDALRKVRETPVGRELATLWRQQKPEKRRTKKTSKTFSSFADAAAATADER